MKRVLIKLVKVYQQGISPYLGPSKCIFAPTCSHYAIQALERHGAIKGSYLAVNRIFRCNPFNKTGGYDPVK